MTNPWIYLIGLLVVGVLFVLLPVVIDAYLRFRGKRHVTCPEAGAGADVCLDTRYAALTAVLGTPRARILSCSLWPTRQGCAQKCLRLPAVAQDAEPVKPRVL